MSCKSAISASMLILMSFLAGTVSAQRFQPFIEPDTFSPDFQFFAPADVSDFGGGKKPNIGFYLTYDRILVNVSRPQNAGNDNLGFPQIGDPGNLQSINGRFGFFEGDWTWGNRWDFGYMTADDHGWAGSVTNISGPNAAYITPQQSLELFVGGTAVAADERIPAIYNLEQSLNKGSLTSVELNKIWRAPAFHSGTIFEPMVGIRYSKFTDEFRRDIYQRYNTAAAAPAGDGFPNFLQPNEIGPWEVIRTRRSLTDNQMLGGQLGFRLHHQTGHWTLSSEVRAFAFQNWQFLNIYEEQTAYRFATPGTRDRWNEVRAAPQFLNNNEFVWGGEIRVEAAYQLTRDIALRSGFTFMDYGTGIARGGVFNPVTSNQDLIITGLTFGLTYNR